jgi:hypothetical protein
MRALIAIFGDAVKRDDGQSASTRMTSGSGFREKLPNDKHEARIRRSTRCDSNFFAARHRRVYDIETLIFSLIVACAA